MSFLHHIVPMFFLIQFLVVMVALVSAMLLAAPQLALFVRDPSRRAAARPRSRSRR